MGFLQKMRELFQASQNQTVEAVELHTDVDRREPESQVTVARGAIGRDNWKVLNAPSCGASSHHATYAMRGKNGAPALQRRDLRTGKKVIERDGFALDLDN